MSEWLDPCSPGVEGTCQGTMSLCPQNKATAHHIVRKPSSISTLNKARTVYLKRGRVLSLFGIKQCANTAFVQGLILLTY